MTVHESDVCIIGAGISAAMLAEKLSELRLGLSITIVEAGRSIFDFENRFKYRERMIKYGENPWPGDFIEGQAADGGISRTMAVGGQALHWGGTCNRFSQEDLRLKSMFGLYSDWPIEWAELEKYYCEAERRLGVSGEPSPFPGDTRSQPYPMKMMPLTWNLERLKEWGDKSGIRFQGTPQAKNTEPYDGRSVCMRCGTCDICPTGARYSPDFTFKRLLSQKKITLHDQTLIRKLALDYGKPLVVARRRPRRTPQRSSGVSRENIRDCFGLHLELAPAAAFGELAISERAGKSGRAGREIHERPRVYSSDDRTGRGDLSEYESPVWAHFPTLFSLLTQRPLRAARSSDLGGRASRAAIEGCRRPGSPWRRTCRGLAIQKLAGDGARPRVLRRPPRGEQRTGARARDQE